MIILLSGLFIAGVALAVYALVPFQWGEKKPQEPVPAPILPEPLEQLNVERQNLQGELELANNVARELKEELAKFKESANAQQLQQLKENKEKLELAQKDNQQLAQKIKSLEEQSAVYLKEIEEHKAINADLLNKLKVFEAQLQEYKQEIEKQKAIIQQPAPAAQEQVSKKEYDELKKKLEEAEQILRIVHGAGK